MGVGAECTKTARLSAVAAASTSIVRVRAP